jgi:hypothetical protein
MGWNSAANAQAQANQQAMMLQAIAAQQQQQTLQQSQQAQQQALQQGQKVATEQYTPYSQFGQQSLNALASAMGLGGGDGYLMRQPTQAELQMDPGYAFRMREGQKALQQQMAAGGLGGSGSALKAATRYGQDMSSQEYGNAYNRFMANRANQMALLQGGVNTGFGAAQGIGNASIGTGTNLANVYGNTAQQIAASQGNLGVAGGQGLVNTGSAYANAAMGPTNLLAALAGQGAQGLGMYAGKKMMG